MNFKVFVPILVSILVQNGLCDKTSEKIYYDVSTYAMCFRRMNGTHQVGCTSERGGNVGILHYIDTEDEVDWLVRNNAHKPYVVLMSPNQFNRVNVDKLRSVDGLISGMMVIHLNVTEDTEPFSPDQSCPNSGHGMYSDTDYRDCGDYVQWNPEGNSLMFEDYNFPIIALVNSTEVNFLRDDCYVKFNKRSASGEIRDYPLCAVQIKDAMDGAKDTPTCIRRSNLVLNLNPDQYCDPLGDYSVVGFNRLLNNSETLPDDSVIMASARLDSFSMFDNLYPSADSAISGIVTLMAAAQALSEISKTEETPLPIMYSFFNGEAFDYIGSSRVVFEMEKDRFPANYKTESPNPSKVGLHNLNSFVELSQVGIPESDTYFIHTDPISYDQVGTQIGTIIEHLADLSVDANVSINRGDRKNPLPPASAQSFLKKDKKLPGVVIADHATSYSNKHYNSRYDRAAAMGVVYPEGMNATDKYDYETEASTRLCNLATLVARTLYSMSTQSTLLDHIKADCPTVSHLLYCMLISPQCELFREVLDSTDNINKLSKVPYPTYVSVFIEGSTSRNQLTLLAHNLLSYFTGRKYTDVDKSECDNMDKNSPYYNYMWMMGPVNTTSQERDGMCVESTVVYSEARSPAFLIDDYDYTSKEYSSWTESRWGNDAFKVRAFLKPSPQLELLTLLLGLALFLVSLPVIFLIDKRSKLLFHTKNSLSSMADNDSH